MKPSIIIKSVMRRALTFEPDICAFLGILGYSLLAGTHSVLIASPAFSSLNPLPTL